MSYEILDVITYLTSFGVKLLNAKVGWMFIQNNGVLVIGGNCKKSPINFMLSLSNMKICLIFFFVISNAL